MGYLLADYYNALINGSDKNRPLAFPSGELDFTLPYDLYMVGFKLDGYKGQTEEFVCSYLGRELRG